MREENRGVKKMNKRILGSNIDFRAYGDTAAAINNTLEDGMLLSTLCEKTGVEASTVQNWVKRGYLSKPDGKKYSAEQAAEVIILNNLKHTVQLDEASAYMNEVKDNSGIASVDILAVLSSSLIRATRFNSIDRASLESVINIEMRSFGIGEKEVAKLLLISALSALCADYKAYAQKEFAGEK